MLNAFTKKLPDCNTVWIRPNRTLPSLTDNNLIMA